MNSTGKSNENLRNSSTQPQRGPASRRASIVRRPSSTNYSLVPDTNSVSSAPVIPPNIRRLSLVGMNEQSFTQSIPEDREDRLSTASPAFGGGILGTVIYDDEPIEGEEGPRRSDTKSQLERSSSPGPGQGPNGAFLRKELSAIRPFQRFSTFTSGPSPIVAQLTNLEVDEDSDAESEASNSSYKQKKDSSLETSIPHLSSFTQELIKKQQKQELTSSQEAQGIVFQITDQNQPILITSNESATTPTPAPQSHSFAVPSLLIPTSVPQSSATSTSLLLPGSDIIHHRRSSFIGNMTKPIHPTIPSSSASALRPSEPVPRIQKSTAPSPPKLVKDKKRQSIVGIVMTDVPKEGMSLEVTEKRASIQRRHSDISHKKETPAPSSAVDEAI